MSQSVDTLNNEKQIEQQGNDYQIVAFCCEHCAYSAADLAGGLRLSYPPTVKIIMLPCTGKMDPLLVLHTLEDGVDGVMVAG